MSAADIQHLTLLLCHLYKRAVCTVSYATPTYYADCLRDRGRHYLTDFFDGHADVRGMTSESVQRTLDEEWYRREGGTVEEGKNLWHSDLDGTMFWL